MTKTLVGTPDPPEPERRPLYWTLNGNGTWVGTEMAPASPIRVVSTAAYPTLASGDTITFNTTSTNGG